MSVLSFRPRLLVPIVACALFVSVPMAWSQQRTSTVIRERLKTRPEDPTLHYYLSLFEIAEGDRRAESRR